MAIQSYKKAPIRFERIPVATIPEAKAGDFVLLEGKEEFVVKQDASRPERITLWDIAAGFVGVFNELIIKSRVAGFLVPFFLIVLGFRIIHSELWPAIEQQIKQATGFYDTANPALVAGDYIERAQYLSNPGSDYFAQLSENAIEASVLQPDPVSNAYTKNFKLSIPSLELNNLNVGANVESGLREIYDKVLNNGLAHFKGTGLPVSQVQNNIVIYGHSSSGDYYERTKDPAGAFSRLHKIKIGDIVEVEIEGKMYKFRVYKSKIVKPDDISIVTGIQNKRTLTLLTCFPNGNSAERFVAIARPVED